MTSGGDTNGGGGISIVMSGSPLIRNNVIRNNSNAGAYSGGIYSHSCSPLIYSNQIYGNTSNYAGAIDCHLGAPHVVGNSIYDNESFSFIGAIVFATVNGGEITNNTISSNLGVYESGGILLADCGNIILKNNILYNNNLWGTYIRSSTGVSLTYSCYYGNTYGDIWGVNPGVGNIFADPLFINPNLFQYNLQSISPCINSGDPASPLDPDGTRADMGALYYDHNLRSMWHIAATGNDSTGDGSETNPFRTIQRGINMSSDQDTILVSDGHYYERISFLSKGIAVASQHLLDGDTSHIQNTIIDGDTLVLGVADTGSVVCFANGEDSTSMLHGMTIINGIGTNDFDIRRGGGVFASSSSHPKVSHCIVKQNGNFGIFYGSLMYLKNCNVTNNLGGGIVVTGSTDTGIINIDSCDISNNAGPGLKCPYLYRDAMAGIRASRISYNLGSGLENITCELFNCLIRGNGGDGIYFQGNSLSSITSCVIDSNEGNGISAFDNSLNVNACVIQGNNIGIHVSTGWATTLTDCIISDHPNGGVITTGNEPTVEFVRCRFVNNHSQLGGAVRLNDHGVFTECVFIDNSAIKGGAVYAADYDYATYHSEPIMSNCAFLNNTADSGSAIYYWRHNDNDNSSLLSSILAFNGPGAAIECGSQSVFPISCTDIHGNPGGDWVGGIDSFASINGNFSLNPRFCDPANGDYHLAANSPCLPANNSCNTLIGAFGQGCDTYWRMWHVATTGNDTTGDGSEGNPFRTVQRGVNSAWEGDTVLVKEGHYYERISLMGKGITVASEHLIDGDSMHIQNTIIDADTLVLGIADTGSVVRFVNEEDSTAILHGFTIQGGNGTLFGTTGRCGGGLFIIGASPKLEYCNIIKNAAVNGGAIFDHENPNRIDISKCKFIGNSSGIFVRDYDSTDDPKYFKIDSCEFHNEQDISTDFMGNVNYSISNSILDSLSIMNGYGDDPYIEIDNTTMRIVNMIIYCGWWNNIRNSSVYGSRFQFGDDRTRLRFVSCIVTDSDVNSANARCDIDSSLYSGIITLNGDVEPQLFITASTLNNSRIIADNLGGGYVTVSNSIIQGAGTAIISGDFSHITANCSNFQNYGISWFEGPHPYSFDTSQVFFADPLFCDTANGNYNVASSSPCLPANNSCNVLIGAFGQGCGIPTLPVIISPLNGAECGSSTVFTWYASTNPDSTDGVFYTIQMDDDSLFASPEIAQSGLQPGMLADDAFAIQLGELEGFDSLEVDTRYYWRVRADDNYGLSSEWTDGTNWFVFMPQNHAPSPPFSGFSPSSGEEVITLTPTLTWDDATDPDSPSDALAYALRLSEDSLFAGFVFHDTTAPGVNQIAPAYQLDDNSQYFYAVRTIDNGGLASDWSATQNFWTNHYNFPPEPFPLFGPADGVKHVVAQTLFSWGGTFDYDPNSSFIFSLQYSPDSLFLNYVRTIPGLADTAFTIATDSLTASGRVYWRVQAVDDDTLIRIGGTPEGPRALVILPPGDANCNGTTNGIDVTFMVSYLKGIGPAPNPLLAGDANGNCAVNGIDVVYLVAYFKGIGAAPVRPDCEIRTE
jgi:predicted outer membrane repeat protein